MGFAGVICTVAHVVQKYNGAVGRIACLKVVPAAIGIASSEEDLLSRVCGGKGIPPAAGYLRNGIKIGRILDCDLLCALTAHDGIVDIVLGTDITDVTITGIRDVDSSSGMFLVKGLAIVVGYQTKVFNTKVFHPPIIVELGNITPGQADDIGKEGGPDPAQDSGMLGQDCRHAVD